MSRSSITSKRSRRLSKQGSTDGAPAQNTYLFDEQPPPKKDTIRLADDEEESCEPLVVTSPGISNSEPPQPQEPHIHESTLNDSLEGTLADEAQKVVVQEDQPSSSEIVNVMREVLDVLKGSTIASKTGKDDRSRFWGLYKRVAEEHDEEFLERYNGDMDIVLIFSGLFSAVSTAFIVAMESNLSPDPNDTTHALLTQLVQIGLGNFTAAGSTPAALASTWSPPTAIIRIQCIAYASLSFSLLAAFGAVLGKQWLGYYKSHRYGRGSEDERAKRRQERFDGIVTWYFDAVVQSFPILLQLSLLLFGIAIGANMWSQQYTIAWVIIATTVFGFLFYSLTVMAALVSPACPFQSPISTILRILRVDKVLRPIVIPAFRYLKQLTTSVHGVYQYLNHTCRTRLSELADSVFAACSSAWRRLQSLFQRLLSWRRSPTRVVDPETQPPDQNLHVVATNQYPLKLNLPDTLTSSLEAPSIKWLLETSTDPEVFLAAASLVHHVDWPLDLDASDALRQLFNVYTACFDVQGRIIPSLQEKASTCTMALCHLYCNRILQGHPFYGFTGEGEEDYSVFEWMMLLKETKVNDNVLVVTTKLFVAKYGSKFPWWSSPKFEACPDSVLEWLSHVLPFHFVTEQMDEDVDHLAITVISKLLCSSSSPQIIANCTLLACIMVGVQFDKKDIVRVDKSSAQLQLAEFLWAQFQQVIWAPDGGDLDSAVRRAWHFDIICLVLDRDLVLPPPKMWSLGVCWKIFSRARSSQHNDRDLSAALREVQRFRFADNRFPSDPADPALLWDHEISWQGNSHSPEDFDWLVDYLGDVCSNDHKTAGDILVLLSSTSVSCSPAKQRLYIEKLIACMGSSMPPRLRHAALRAAHSSREVFASTDVVGDADMVLTKLSPAILTAVCPQSGATPTDDGPDCFFHRERDLCYLELIFALARNLVLHSHLIGDGHINRCNSIVAKSCDFYMHTYTYLKRLDVPRPHRPHAFYLAGIFLRMPSEQVSVTSLSSITEQQWWDMMRKAWYSAFLTIDNPHCIEFLPVLVEGTRKYMRGASKSDLQQLISDVDDLMESPGKPGLLEQREGVAVAAVKELRGIAKDKLDSFS